MLSRTIPEPFANLSGNFPHSVVKGSSVKVSQVQCAIRPTVGRGVLELDALPARIKDKIAVDEAGCWVWIASTGSSGYGQVWNGTTMRRAHRVVYATLVGPIPDGLECDHLCRVRRCVNPAHIDLVDHAENMRRMHGGTGPQAAKERRRRHAERARRAREQARIDAGGWVAI